jgi:hypothetical protein
MTTKEYFSIRDYLEWFSIPEDATPSERMLEFMTYYLGKTEDEVRQMNPSDLFEQYENVSKIFEQTAGATFFPFIEIDGKLYGYIDLSKMTLGEYVDIEKYSKNTFQSMAELMAILYRPVKSHKFNSLKFETVNTWNVFRNKLTNFYDYYELEEYNYSNSATNIEKMERLPVAFAQGALSFFLLQTSSVATSLKPSLDQKTQKLKLIEMSKRLKSLVIEKDIQSIGDGLRQFAIYQQHPSLTSQGISVSRISTTSSYLTGWRTNATLTSSKARKLNNKKSFQKTNIELNNV